jgi:hypothetical protein
MFKQPDPEKIKQILAPILWDYQLDPLQFYKIAVGQSSKIGLLNQERALLRILERLNWYDIVELLGLDFLKEHLNFELINKLWIVAQRERYEIILQVLQGNSISFPKWGPETRQKLKHAVLSHRWYSTQ